MQHTSEVTPIFAALAAEFEEGVKVRAQAGRQIPYITARTAMNRLDNVLGPENWWDEYPTVSQNSVVCRLTIRLPDGTTITKSDAGGFAGMADSGDDDKSGYSDAFKRAAVKFGVARYLYGDGVPKFVEGGVSRPAAAPVANGNGNGNGHANGTASPSRQTNYDNFRLPRPGKQVYAWAKSMEQHFGTTVVDGMKAGAKSRGWDTNFTDWNEEQVNAVCREAVAFLMTLPNYKGEFDGKVDVKPAPEQPYPEDGSQETMTEEDLKRAKSSLVEKLKSFYMLAHGQHATPAELKAELARVSAKATYDKQLRGRVCQSLSAETNYYWVTGMLAVVNQETSDLTRATPAVAEVAADDDIPF